MTWLQWKLHITSGGKPYSQRAHTEVPELCHQRAGRLSAERTDPCAASKPHPAALCRPHPKAGLSTSSAARTTTEGHGSNYSSRQRNLQGEVTLKKKRKREGWGGAGGLCVSKEPSHWSLIKEALMMINYVTKWRRLFLFLMYHKMSSMLCAGTAISKRFAGCAVW